MPLSCSHGNWLHLPSTSDLCFYFLQISVHKLCTIILLDRMLGPLYAIDQGMNGGWLFLLYPPPHPCLFTLYYL